MEIKAMMSTLREAPEQGQIVPGLQAVWLCGTFAVSEVPIRCTLIELSSPYLGRPLIL